MRLPDGEDWEKMNKELLTDCAQLTKANSIEGNKKDNVTVIYTPWSNLKKDGSMAVGQVGFKDPRKVRWIVLLLFINSSSVNLICVCLRIWYLVGSTNDNAGQAHAC